MCVLHAYMYVYHVCAGAWGGWEEGTGSPGTGARQLWVAIWGLRADFGSSARAASALNWGAASPASHEVLKMAQLSGLVTAWSCYQKSIVFCAGHHGRYSDTLQAWICHSKKTMMHGDSVERIVMITIVKWSKVQGLELELGTFLPLPCLDVLPRLSTPSVSTAYQRAW